jgi:hypothetical protein
LLQAPVCDMIASYYAGRRLPDKVRLYLLPFCFQWAMLVSTSLLAVSVTCVRSAARRSLLLHRAAAVAAGFVLPSRIALIAGWL